MMPKPVTAVAAVAKPNVRREMPCCMDVSPFPETRVNDGASDGRDDAGRQGIVNTTGQRYATGSGDARSPLQLTHATASACRGRNRPAPADAAGSARWSALP